MNILIVGNGFDLSHYLPTKYDHFLFTMKVIENRNSLEDLNFKEISDGFSDKEAEFILDTKDKYKVEEVKIPYKQCEFIKSKLKANSWFHYFKNHIDNVDTWIDLENRIEELLNSFAEYLNGKSTLINEKTYQNLQWFELFNNKSAKRTLSNGINLEPQINEIPRKIINSKFCYRENMQSGFSSSSFINYLQIQLEEFIEIFNLYLELVIDKLEPKSKFKIESKDWVQPNLIFSFNYTNTFRKFYQKDTEAEFLHGCFGEEQNIVLGVSDLEDESLKKLKSYGFTKYHQKLFKGTDYLFLDKFKKKVEVHKRRIEYFEKDFGYEDPTERKSERQKIMEMESPLDLNIKIWGHSLDSSDKEYILDLFSLNDDIDRKVRVVIYYYDDNAKFSLLNNLLDILKKDKVEKWMKNKWLIFEKNPEVKLVKTIPEQTV